MLPSESHITPSVKELGISIFAVCRQLYHEARPVFFSDNSFDFTTASAERSRDFVALVRIAGPPACALLRDVRLTYTPIRDKTAVLIFQAIPQLTSIRKCVIMLGLGTSSGQWDKEEFHHGLSSFLEHTVRVVESVAWLMEHKVSVEFGWDEQLTPTTLLAKRSQRKGCGIVLKECTSVGWVNTLPTTNGSMKRISMGGFEVSWLKVCTADN